MADDTERLTSRLASLGFADKTIKETLKNKKQCAALVSILDEADIPESGADLELDPASTPLLNSLAIATKDVTLPGRPYIARAIREGRLKSGLQVDHAIKYAKETGGKIDDVEFDKVCGVGVSFTKDQVIENVKAWILEKKTEIEEGRYKLLGTTIANIKSLTDLKWANALDVKNAVDAEFLSLLGPKDERDIVKKAKGGDKDAKGDSSKKPAAAAAAADEPDPLNTTGMFEGGFLGALHKPGGNPQIKPELRDAHLAATGGKVFTRFPPEPNGYLHIGHSKAIAVNFGYARYNGGHCYLRYDDTNPEAEEEKYFTSIKEIVEWLGFKPYKITYSSDHFQKLYDLAEDLIKRDKGYVCHCTAEEIQKQRGGKEGEAGPRYGCAHRNRPVEESLAEFRNMRDGKYKPKEALLRMKQDMESGNPQMWDLTAYRVLDAEHHRTGGDWKIYPTYDFTHCLCDSFENITHSLCTTEFITARESYDWLCDALEIYKPRQSEYGRLNLTGTIMSKRKIAKLVNEKHVRGWDDPRLYTLVAIRRRGVPPGAILSFVNELGVTTATTHIMTVRFEQSVRRYLEQTVPRLSLILDPILVTLENLPEGYYEEVSVPFKPNDAKMGEHMVAFTNKFYIDRSDFREEDSKDYFRMAPGKSVGLLKVPHTVRVTSFVKDDTTGRVTEIKAHYENDVPFKKPKTYIQWVGHAPEKGSPVKVEARLFNQLFKSENPESNPDGFLADINPNSEEIYADAIIDTGFHEVRKRAPWPAREGEQNDGPVGPESVRFQGLRVGYFAMDCDTAGDKIVLNRIVTLKEDVGKN
ncbi:hypothetical protein H072_2511 [Dactylellina haptotyla CBS 200.50]|uniref:glutamine--tRNA ligase n=1 Tax=Dactylellina haptotyla (strain CBS 200.50) TaxID=1284197 RepID=S8AQX9_DACHA|nr:hypothetical protein H072_2511 [Dactylellina haptotyla CBS 200.50]